MVFPLKVLISPFKTFREMAQNPQVKGLVVVLALILVATGGIQYVSATKIFLAQQTSLLASNMFTGYMLSSLMDTALTFFVNWIIYACVLILLTKVFGGNARPWRTIFILIGYAFSVFIVRIAVTTVLISTLPELHLAISTWPPATKADYTVYVNQFNAIWAPTLASQTASFLVWIVYVWFVMLGAIAVHASTGITRGKATIISVSAYMINFILNLYLPVML